jgi:hypothetical protein
MELLKAAKAAAYSMGGLDKLQPALFELRAVLPHYRCRNSRTSSDTPRAM